MKRKANTGEARHERMLFVRRVTRRALAPRAALRVLRAVLLLWSAWFACLAWPRQAGAQNGVESPTTLRTAPYSAYEQASLDAALRELGASIEPAPEGKTFEGADIVTLEVLEERDPLQGWGIERNDGTQLSANEILNDLHATSRHPVIEREVLLVLGRPYEQALADQSARNLRGLVQLSLVIVVPIRGSAPDRVRLLVITKDVWSIRLNSDFKVGSGGLESLLLQPTESNLAGTHQLVYTQLLLVPKSYELGVGYTARRLAGTRVQLSASAFADINRDSGKTEGSGGAVTAGVPLFSLKQKWAWSVGTSWSDAMSRRYVNAKLSTYDARATPALIDSIPFEYRGIRLVESAGVTRSFGLTLKNDFTFGMEMNKASYQTDDLSRYNPAAAREFVTRNVPVGDTRVGPYAQWRSYQTNYLETLDLETLALQEDYRLGHNVYVRLYPVVNALGSSRDFLGAYAGLEYTIALFSSGIARASIESTVEAEVDRLTDASVAGHLRVVSPRLPFGRVVIDAAGLNRYRNYLNRLTFLGGNSRLRGYPSNFYVGKDWVAGNVEFRTRPLEVLGSELAAAAFYDAGNAFNGFDTLQFKHSVGVGFRFLFPQLDRFVLRGDFGFPLGTRDAGVSPLGFYFSFQQAFGFDTINGPPGGALGQ
jgi:hypothetical protein